VHEDGAAFEIGDGLGHLLVPAEPADVVDDLRARAHGGAGYSGFVGVHGEDDRGIFFL